MNERRQIFTDCLIRDSPDFFRHERRLINRRNDIRCVNSIYKNTGVDIHKFAQAKHYGDGQAICPVLVFLNLLEHDT